MADTRVLGNYELLEKIGSGSMGVVYRARQISMERIVALKVLPPKLAADDRFVQRFLREARSAGKINHANIVKVSETGTLSDGRVYVSMEYLPRGSVEDEASGALLGLPRAKQLMVDFINRNISDS